MDNRKIVGIIAIILGLLVIIFPFAGVGVISLFAGLSIFLLGLYFIIGGANFWSVSKGTSAIYLIVGIIGFILGIMLIGNVSLFSALMGIYFYIIGIMMVIAGITSIFARDLMVTKSSGVVMLILGILTIILGALSLASPVYVAIILGISLIFEGIAVYAIGDEF
ncbi:MAG: DUF308 domain-containing protein [Methanobacteriaceae archaeon]|nr:DUF308 domain-containing protein [Methanobacteriaceae archaeon]